MNTVEEILDILRSQGKTIATAESITAGNIQRMIASISGASDVFKGGITAYKLSVKSEVLGVDKDVAIRTNCVDPEIARQMAQGALKLFRTDYAIATCGYAEPFPSEKIESPFAYIAIVVRTEGEIVFLAEEKVELSGNRIEAQIQAAALALSSLRDLLLH